MKIAGKYARAGILFLLPSFLVYIIVFFYPLVLCVINSFSRVNMIAGTSTFNGVINYTNLFARADFVRSVKVTLLYVVMTVPLLLVVSIWAANTIAQFKGKFSNIATTIVFLPFMVSMVSAGIVWNWLFNPSFGLINSILQMCGLTTLPSWLLSDKTALISVVIITLWVRCPFSTMILYGGMKSVPLELYEAAALDGINPFQRFFKLTLPLINPQIVLVFTLDMIFAFRSFDQIFTATGGGPAGATRTVMIYMISDLFTINYGMASALTVLVLASLFAISLLQQVTLKRVVEY